MKREADELETSGNDRATGLGIGYEVRRTRREYPSQTYCAYRKLVGGRVVG